MSPLPHRPEALTTHWPRNQYVSRLLGSFQALGVGLKPGGVREQWLYRPDERTLYVWTPDLTSQSLSFLVVILAHELGHVLDFDEKPQYREQIRHLHWSQVPLEIERSAFIRGFRILQALQIPVSLEAYLQMIDEPMASQVGAALRAGAGQAFPDAGGPLEETAPRSEWAAG